MGADGGKSDEWPIYLAESIEEANGIVVLIDAAGAVVGGNSKFEIHCRRPRHNHINDYFDEEGRERYRYSTHESEGMMLQFPSRLRFADGRRLDALFTMLPLGARGHLLIAQTGNAVANFANYDYLTKLPNRREARHLLRIEWGRAKRRGLPFAIALADIDHFKRINDKHGHDVGDKVLQHLADFFRSHMRAGDWCSRWGGEEFLFMLADVADGENYADPLERMRKSIAETPFIGPPRIDLTVSFGVAFSRAEMPIDSTIKAADRMLYQAKSNGRNRVEAAARVGFRESQESRS